MRGSLRFLFFFSFLSVCFAVEWVRMPVDSEEESSSAGSDEGDDWGERIRKLMRRVSIERPDPEDFTSLSDSEEAVSTPSRTSSFSSTFTRTSEDGDTKRTVVKNSCRNDKCELCVDSECFKGTYRKVKVQRGCPTAVCGKDCAGFVLHSDDCPICQCQEFSTREPCNEDEDCRTNRPCKDGMCRYPKLEQDRPLLCSFNSDCPEDEKCKNKRCKEMAGEGCFFDSDCPEGSECEEGVCRSTGGRRSAERKRCVFHFECPSRFLCKELHCAPGGPPHRQRSCISDQMCLKSEKCEHPGMSCLPRD